MKSPKLVIDIRLTDEIQSRKNQTRKVTPLSTHPIKVIADWEERVSPPKEIPVKLYSKVPRSKKGGRSSNNKFRKSKNISRYSTTPSHMVSSKQMKYSEFTASEEKIRQLWKGKRFRGNNESRLK